MYKVLKPKGAVANVTVMNTDTRASVVIGKPSVEILSILNREEGYSTTPEDPAKQIDVFAEWELDISEKTGKLLAESAMKMHKPKRIKKDASEQKVDTPKTQTSTKQPVDVFDLIFGIES